MELQPGTKVRVTAGPWPERIGLIGTVVEPDSNYPFEWDQRKKGWAQPPGVVVIFIEDDPLNGPDTDVDHDPSWTCVALLNSIEVVE